MSTNITKALKDLSSKRKEIQREAQSRAREILAPGLEQFMKEHPEIEAVRWAQYTPYFNDGDTCEFSVGELLYKLVGADEEESDYDDGFTCMGTYGKPPGFAQQSWYKALAELENALSGAEEELLAAFGDHVRVTVTKNGVDIDDYDHD